MLKKLWHLHKPDPGQLGVVCEHITMGFNLHTSSKLLTNKATSMKDICITQESSLQNCSIHYWWEHTQHNVLKFLLFWLFICWTKCSLTSSWRALDPEGDREWQNHPVVANWPLEPWWRGYIIWLLVGNHLLPFSQVGFPETSPLSGTPNMLGCTSWACLKF